MRSKAPDRGFFFGAGGCERQGYCHDEERSDHWPHPHRSRLRVLPGLMGASPASDPPPSAGPADSSELEPRRRALAYPAFLTACSGERMDYSLISDGATVIANVSRSSMTGHKTPVTCLSDGGIRDSTAAVREFW